MALVVLALLVAVMGVLLIEVVVTVSVLVKTLVWARAAIDMPVGVSSIDVLIDVIVAVVISLEFAVSVSCSRTDLLSGVAVDSLKNALAADMILDVGALMSADTNVFVRVMTAWEFSC